MPRSVPPWRDYYWETIFRLRPLGYGGQASFSLPRSVPSKVEGLLLGFALHSESLLHTSVALCEGVA